MFQLLIKKNQRTENKFNLTINTELIIKMSMKYLF